jgi:hypothetical protein
MSIGKAGGAYAKIDKTQNYLGEAIQRNQDLSFRNRQEKAQREQVKTDLERQRQNDLSKEFEASAQFRKENPFVRTGISSIDAQNRQTAENAYRKHVEAKRNFAKTGDNQYLAEAENIYSSLKQASEFPTEYNTFKEGLSKGIQSGQYNLHSAQLAEQQLQNDMGNIVQDFDANGNRTFTIIKSDEKGNPIPVKSGLSSKELMAMYTPKKSFNIDNTDMPEGFKGKSLIDRYKESLGEKREGFVGTGKNRKKKIFYEGAEENAKEFARQSMLDPDNVYETFRRLGIDPENKANYTSENILKAQTELEKTLLNKAPVSLFDDPSLDEEKVKLQKTKEANDQYNANRTYNQNQQKIDNEVSKESETSYERDPLTGQVKSAKTKSVSKKVAPVKNKENKSEYTNITETDGGTLGIKNGKWYNIKTGKLAK